MRIGVLGSGDVGKTLAAGFLKHGHEVAIGTRTPEKLAQWAQQNPRGRIGSFGDAASFGEIVVLAVKGHAAADALRSVAPGSVDGKIVIDTSNPIAEAPPENGVLKYYTDINRSQMENLQKEFESARFVKAFNSVGAASMVNPQFRGGSPTMFICGNDDSAKKAVSGILAQFGWETADMGKAEGARAIEPLCMLWCIPGFLRNDWVHSLRLLSS